jgi:hypothetical protein
MRHDSTFSSLKVFWECEIEGGINHILDLKDNILYKSIVDNEILECKIRLQLIMEQIDFFKHTNIDEHDYSSIDTIINTHKDFLKMNNII